MKNISILLILIAALPIYCTDIDSLTSRLRAEYSSVDTTGAGAKLSGQLANGSWSDINYADRSSATWAPQTHISRVRSMAAAFIKSQGADTAMKRGVIAGLDYWFINDASIYSSNWWYNDIGQQLDIGPTLVMMKSYLDSSRIAQTVHFLDTMSVSLQMTGQNLMWTAQQKVWKGCALDSSSMITTGLNLIKNEIKITNGDGIQSDFSFYQHGPLLYNGGYGRGFMEDAAFWLVVTQGLVYAFDAAKVSVVTSFILDGSQWMIRRGNWDFACGGREISRQGFGNYNSAFNSKLLAIQSPRSAELQSMASHTKGLNDSALTGDKHFPRNDYHVKRTADYHFSVRMCSKRTMGSEAINGEHKKNYYIPFGATTLMRRGDEYNGIYPIWDWGRIPGVTSPHKVNPGAADMTGTTDFVGGVSDGKHGAVGFDFKWDQTIAKKAWFCFDDEIVALGSGITGAGGSPVFTSINQCFLKGTVVAATDSGTGTVQSNGSRVINNPKWIYHDSVGYCFPKPVAVNVANQSQSGNWYSINNMYTSATVTGDVFSLWIDHGINPTNSSYEYVIIPGKSESEIKNYSKNIPVRTIINTQDIQGARHDSLGISGIVFYAPGTAVIRFGLAVA
ncbi:MAG: hypothetical protein JNL74_06540, partial [Fibrobacteres bacterium]|nr:hypothetical protein [Fibrobacterota bacterium]